MRRLFQNHFSKITDNKLYDNSFVDIVKNRKVFKFRWFRYFFFWLRSNSNCPDDVVHWVVPSSLSFFIWLGAAFIRGQCVNNGNFISICGLWSRQVNTISRCPRILLPLGFASKWQGLLQLSSTFSKSVNFKVNWRPVNLGSYCSRMLLALKQTLPGFPGARGSGRAPRGACSQALCYGRTLT